MSSPLSHYHLWQLRELAQGSQEWETLVLTLTGCSTQESGLCTQSGQHTRTDPYFSTLAAETIFKCPSLSLRH